MTRPAVPCSTPEPHGPHPWFASLIATGTPMWCPGRTEPQPMQPVAGIDSPIGACAEKLGHSLGTMTAVASCLYQHEHIGAHRTADGETWITGPLATPAGPYCHAVPPVWHGQDCDRPAGHNGPHITSGDDLNSYQLWGQRCGAPHPHDASPCDREAGHTGRHADSTNSKWANLCRTPRPHDVSICTRDAGHDGDHADSDDIWSNRT